MLLGSLTSDFHEVAPEGEENEFSWSDGTPFPVVDGHKIYPPATQLLWYAGSVCSRSLGPARSISVSIRVPYSVPKSDEFYYILLSDWDSNGSYNQIGFSNYYGTWGLTYSWTSGLHPNETYHYNPNVMVLSLGTTYTFSITTENGFTNFSARQGGVQVWSEMAPTGGDYLFLEFLYLEHADYTNYQEVWQTSVPGGSPAFDFFFFNNTWTTLDGNLNTATNWTKYLTNDKPDNVYVIIENDTVLIDNPLSTVLFESNLQEASIVFNGSIYTHGQNAVFSPGNYSITANAPPGYQFRSWYSRDYPNGGVYVANLSENPTIAQISSDGTLEAHFVLGDPTPSPSPSPTSTPRG